jgi:hypothetical protein
MKITFICCVFNEIKIAPDNLEGKNVISYMNDIPAVPPDCSSFYINNPVGWSTGNTMTDSMYQANVIAMIIAEKIHIPTILGVSSNAPPNWDLNFLPKNTFVDRVKKRAIDLGINTKNLCEYDMKEKKWSFLGI